MGQRESDFRSENFNEKFVSHCFETATEGGNLSRQFSLSRHKFALFGRNPSRRQLICPTDGPELKGNVTKFSRSEVVLPVRIGVIT